MDFFEEIQAAADHGTWDALQTIKAVQKAIRMIAATRKGSYNHPKRIRVPSVRTIDLAGWVENPDRSWLGIGLRLWSLRATAFSPPHGEYRLVIKTSPMALKALWLLSLGGTEGIIGLPSLSLLLLGGRKMLRFLTKIYRNFFENIFFLTETALL